MTAEQLDALSALVETHPGPYEVFRYDPSEEAWGLGDEHHDILFDAEDAAGKADTAWLDALCTLANAVPALLAHARGWRGRGDVREPQDWPLTTRTQVLDLLEHFLTWLNAEGSPVMVGLDWLPDYRTLAEDFIDAQTWDGPADAGARAGQGEG